MPPKTLPDKSPDNLSELVAQDTNAQLPERKLGEPVYPKELDHLNEVYLRNQKLLQERGL